MVSDDEIITSCVQGSGDKIITPLNTGCVFNYYYVDNSITNYVTL